MARSGRELKIAGALARAGRPLADGERLLVLGEDDDASAWELRLADIAVIDRGGRVSVVKDRRGRTGEVPL